LLCPVPTGQAHPAVAAKNTALAQFMIAISRQQPVASFGAQLVQALIHALIDRLITYPDESGVAGKVAIGDQVIILARLFQETVQEMVLVQRTVHPEKAAI